MPHFDTPSYSLGAKSGTMAAGLAGASPIVSIRWSTPTLLCVVKSLRLSVGTLGTAFAAGGVAFDLITARAWSAADTDGGAVAWTVTGSGKRRAAFADSAFGSAGEIRVATTATLTAGTRVLDTNPLNTIATSVPAVAGQPILTNVELVPQYPSYPTVLSAASVATSTGLVIRATVPATGTWQFSLGIDWEEVSDW